MRRCKRDYVRHLCYLFLSNPAVTFTAIDQLMGPTRLIGIIGVQYCSSCASMRWNL
jgi:hypothetical protein